MRVSVVVSTKDRAKELARLLESIGRQTLDPDEILIIDAAPDSETRRVAESSGLRGLRYLAFPSSLTQARNKGVAETSGDFVVFLDDDLVLDEAFLEEVVRPLAADPGLAGATGDIEGHPRLRGGLKHALQVFFQLPCDGDGRFRLSGAPTMVHGSSEPCDVEFLPGGLTAWRREVFSRFSFDESLPGLGINEDVDFSYRVSRVWRNAYAPKARVRHLRPSLERESRLDYLGRELASAWHLYKKNGPKDPLHCSAFLWHQAGLLVRFFFRRFLRR